MRWSTSPRRWDDAPISHWTRPERNLHVSARGEVAPFHAAPKNQPVAALRWLRRHRQRIAQLPFSQPPQDFWHLGIGDGQRVAITIARMPAIAQDARVVAHATPRIDL